MFLSDGIKEDPCWARQNLAPREKGFFIAGVKKSCSAFPFSSSQAAGLCSRRWPRKRDYSSLSLPRC